MSPPATPATLCAACKMGQHERCARRDDIDTSAAADDVRAAEYACDCPCFRSPVDELCAADEARGEQQRLAGWRAMNGDEGCQRLWDLLRPISTAKGHEMFATFVAGQIAASCVKCGVRWIAAPAADDELGVVEWFRRLDELCGVGPKKNNNNSPATPARRAK